jgi:hypothetical protein
MSEINEKEIERRFEVISKFEINPEVTVNDLERVRETLTEQMSRQQPREQKIWRIIMKSPITKLAAAAVIIIAAILALHNGSVNITSPAFGLEDVIAAMQKAKWMHVKFEVTELKVDPNTAEKMKVVPETWISLNPCQGILIGADGSITFSEDDLGKSTRYDPQTNTITIYYSANTASVSGSMFTDFAEMLPRQIAEMEKRGAKLTYSDGVYQNNAVTVISIDYSDDQESRTEMSMFVDPLTRLPKKLTSRQTDSKGQIVGFSGEFDYPDSGPTDIYEAGAPRDAQLKIIDERPTPEFLEAIKPYRTARENLVSRYILIVTHWQTSEISRVDVIYNDGRKQRFESHSVFKPGEAIYEMWPVYSAGMGTTFDSLLQWAQQGKSGSVTIYLYDGEYHYKFERDDADKWSADKKQYSPDFNPNPNGDLADLGWSPISNNGKVVENDYAVAHNLLCVETCIEHRITDGKLMHPAQKNIRYLDPQHGYICRREEVYAHHQRSGNTPVEELNFDPKEIPSEPYSITEFTEFGRTDTGQWYPRTIEHSSGGWDYKGNRLQLRLSSIKKIFLQTSCEFPVDIFDPDKVMPKDGQAEQSQRKSYKEIVNEAIKIIDSREDWPEPKELVQRYWQARAAKDYDTMAILWPGSPTWNQKLLANEKPAEYVFGETEFPQYGGAYVPYAEKTYYEKNGKYNLKMWLHNEKSTKGRYYIISGN